MPTPAEKPLTWSDVTPKAAFLGRRALIAGAAAFAVAGPAAAKLAAQPSPYSSDATPNSLEEITSYNNFYEFGTSKGDPARYAGKLEVEPWTVLVDGEVYQKVKSLKKSI